MSEVKLEDIKLKAILDKPFFSDRYLGIRKNDRRKYNILIFPKNVFKEKNYNKKLLKEIINVKSYKDQITTACLVGESQTDEQYIYIFDYAPYPSLNLYLRDVQNLSESHSCFLLGQIIEIYDTILNDKNQKVKDISTFNVMIFDKGQKVKILDLGLNYFHLMFSKTLGLQPSYLIQYAPEAYKNYKDYQIDKSPVWSIGIIFYFMLNGCYPVKINSPQLVWDSILNLKQLNILSYKNKISEDTQKSLQRMICIDPQKRISWKEIKQKYCGFKDIPQIVEGDYNPAWDSHAIDEQDIQEEMLISKQIYQEIDKSEGNAKNFKKSGIKKSTLQQSKQLDLQTNQNFQEEEDMKLDQIMTKIKNRSEKELLSSSQRQENQESFSNYLLNENQQTKNILQFNNNKNLNQPPILKSQIQSKIQFDNKFYLESNNNIKLQQLIGSEKYSYPYKSYNSNISEISPDKKFIENNKLQFDNQSNIQDVKYLQSNIKDLNTKQKEQVGKIYYSNEKEPPSIDYEQYLLESVVQLKGEQNKNLIQEDEFMDDLSNNNQSFQFRSEKKQSFAYIPEQKTDSGKIQKRDLHTPTFEFKRQDSDKFNLYQNDSQKQENFEKDKFKKNKVNLDQKEYDEWDIQIIEIIEKQHDQVNMSQSKESECDINQKFDSIVEKVLDYFINYDVFEKTVINSENLFKKKDLVVQLSLCLILKRWYINRSILTKIILEEIDPLDLKKDRWEIFKQSDAFRSLSLKIEEINQTIYQKLKEKNQKVIKLLKKVENKNFVEELKAQFIDENSLGKEFDQLQFQLNMIHYQKTKELYDEYICSDENKAQQTLLLCLLILNTIIISNTTDTQVLENYFNFEDYKKIILDQNLENQQIITSIKQQKIFVNNIQKEFSFDPPDNLTIYFQDQ